MSEFAEQGRVKNEVRKRLARRLRAENIGLPYPMRTVFLRGSGQREKKKPEGEATPKADTKPDTKPAEAKPSKQDPKDK